MGPMRMGAEVRAVTGSPSSGLRVTTIEASPLLILSEKPEAADLRRSSWKTQPGPGGRVRTAAAVWSLGKVQEAMRSPLLSSRRTWNSPLGRMGTAYLGESAKV